MASYTERRGQIDPGVKYATPNATALISQLGEFVGERTKAVQTEAKQASAAAGMIEQERANEERRRTAARASNGESVDLTKPWLVREEAATFMGKEYADAYNNAARSVFHSQVQTELMEKLADLKQKYHHDPKRKRGDFLNEANKLVQSTRQMLASAPETRDLAQAEFTEYAEKFAQNSYMDIVMEDHNIQTKKLKADYSASLWKRRAAETDTLVDLARTAADPVAMFKDQGAKLVAATRKFIEDGALANLIDEETKNQINDIYAKDFVTRTRLALRERGGMHEINFVKYTLNNGEFFDENQFDWLQTLNDDLDNGIFSMGDRRYEQFFAIETLSGGSADVQSKYVDVNTGKEGIDTMGTLQAHMAELRDIAKAYGKTNLADLYERKRQTVATLVPFLSSLATMSAGKAKARINEFLQKPLEGIDPDMFKTVVNKVREQLDAKDKAIRSGNYGNTLDLASHQTKYDPDAIKSEVRKNITEHLDLHQKTITEKFGGDVESYIQETERTEVALRLKERQQLVRQTTNEEGRDVSASEVTPWSTRDSEKYSARISSELRLGNTAKAQAILMEYIDISERVVPGSTPEVLTQLDKDGQQGLGTILRSAWMISNGDGTVFNDLVSASVMGMNKKIPPDAKPNYELDDKIRMMGRAQNEDPSALQFMVDQAWRYYYSQEQDPGKAMAYADKKVKAMFEEKVGKRSEIKELANGSAVMLPPVVNINGEAVNPFDYTDAEERMDNILTDSFLNQFRVELNLPRHITTKDLGFESQRLADGRVFVALVNKSVPRTNENYFVKVGPTSKMSATRIAEWYSTNYKSDNPSGLFSTSVAGSKVGFYIGGKGAKADYEWF